MRERALQPLDESDIVLALWEKDLANVRIYAPDEYLLSKIDIFTKQPLEVFVDRRKLFSGQIQLSDDDLKAIANWMEETVRSHEPEILERVPGLKESLAQIPDPQRRTQALVFMVHRSGFRRDWLKPTPEEIERLKSTVSTEAGGFGES